MILRPSLLAASTLVLTAGPLAAQSDINVPAAAKVILNESGSYQNVTVASGATLQTISSNSGGAGNHGIGITLAAGGAGTIQNDGVIEFTATDQNNTTVFAYPVTISGSGTLAVSPQTANV